jgi:inhibitor of KinA
VKVKIAAASDSSVMIVLGGAISEETRRRVMAVFRSAQKAKDARIRNIHLAYTTVMLDFDPLRMTHEEAEEFARRLAREAELDRDDAAAGADADGRLVTIPVCYDAEFGLDLEDVARHAGIAASDVIRMHTAATYRVHFLGFSPGFAYLGGLAEALRTPRLETPRKLVRAGTVAIGGGHTGIYPVDSPGGWRLIGRTPVKMFDAEEVERPTRLEPGERVEFRAIGRAEFDEAVGTTHEH